jgi:hypothetical protein
VTREGEESVGTVVRWSKSRAPHLACIIGRPDQIAGKNNVDLLRARLCDAAVQRDGKKRKIGHNVRRCSRRMAAQAGAFASTTSTELAYAWDMIGVNDDTLKLKIA